MHGILVVEAEFGSEAMNAALAKSDFRKSAWGQTPRGHLALQNHHSVVLFHNVKIRVLPAAGSN
ncbi:MAG TPA: hypothetical protein VIK18_26355 [Pirellulales bacterium]